MRRLLGTLVSIGVVAVVAALGACSSDGVGCYAGDFRACTCASGAQGYASCEVAQEAYGACTCDGKTPGVDGSVLLDASDAASSKRAFMDGCQTNEDCETGLCFSFNAKGPRCTKTCKSAEECPPPSTGCNNQGVCKAP